MKHSRRTFLLLPLVFLAFGLWQDSRPVKRDDVTAPVTVVLVRHAEKAMDDPRDPQLSEAGHERAEALAKLLGSAGVTHLFSTEYIRTKTTLAPLATDAKLEVEVISARQQPELLARIAGLAPGSFAVVAGHSNTVPAIAEALGCKLSNLHDTPRGSMLGENEYDRLFLLTLPASASKGAAPNVVELRF